MGFMPRGCPAPRPPNRRAPQTAVLRHRPRVAEARPHSGSGGEVRRRLRWLAEGTGGDPAHQSAGRAPARNPS
ncbi:unnamed protein product [[Actinomadura] parvosata subsp. kistnae]|nr:unnamed protein product [Actinomadura parvosata subsp. kistnae]